MATKTKFSLNAEDKDSYLERVLAFPLTSINSHDHVVAAQKVMDKMLAQSDLDHGDEIYLDALSDLVAAFEDAHVVFGPASDAEMLRHLLEAKGVTQAQLSKDTGIAKSSISEVLAGRKAFSRQMIRKLAEYFNVQVGVLASNV